MRRFLVLACLLANLGEAADPAPAIRVEPASKRPGYAVVAFGAKEQRPIWLVLDGGVLLVDRDGNRDLREPRERVLPDDRGNYVTDVLACDAEGREGTFRLRVTIASEADGPAGIKCLSVHPVADIQQFHATAGFIPFAGMPEDAPTIPIDGPLCFVLMDHWTGDTKCRLLPRAGGAHEFSILVATAARGITGEAYVYPNLYALQGEDLPLVRAEFEDLAKGALAPPPRVWQCECARRYRCTVTVPPAAATKRATLLVSFPGWRHGELKPARFELGYAAAPAK